MKNINSGLSLQSVNHPEELEIQTSSIRLAAKCWGNPDGMPVLGFHGWLDNAATFDNLAPLLPELRLLSIDLAGHGYSDHRPPGSAYYFIDMVMDVIEAADVLGLERFSLLGHSMGAGVASYLAGTIQEKIENVILIEGLGSIVQEAEKMPENLREVATQWLRRTQKKLPVYPDVESAVKARYQVGGISESSVRSLVDRGLKPVNGGYTWRSDPNLKMKSRHYLTEEQACAFIKQITAPVLLIEAENTEKDHWYELFQKRIPHLKHMRHQTVAGGHHLHLDNPEPIAAVIREFLQDLSEKP
ncbi:MAG: Tropinesterase [Deltaproteobacteria bacterium]|jgi:pimeloyl-ACP methyl ester carboxylesterase|nr:Tropinesterase [Deltaproteobacteria bacterium]